jgi:hypothetical protein
MNTVLVWQTSVIHVELLADLSFQGSSRRLGSWSCHVDIFLCDLPFEL